MVATCTVSGIVKDVNNVAIPYAELFFSRKSFLGQDGDVIAKWQVATKANNSGLISIALKPGNYTCVAKWSDQTAEFKVAVPDVASIPLASCIGTADIDLVHPLVLQAEAARDIAQQWATNPEDDDVTGYAGQFSARHHALKAQQWATNPEDDDVTGYAGQFSARHHAIKAAADRVQTGADRVQTGLDRLSTAADRLALSTAMDLALSNMVWVLHSWGDWILSGVWRDDTPINGWVLTGEWNDASSVIA